MTFLNHEHKIKAILRNLLFLTIIICISFVSANRGDFGTDTKNYIDFYKSVDSTVHNLLFEPGFIWYSKFLSFLGFNVKQYLFICSFISLFSAYVAFNKVGVGCGIAFMLFSLTYILSLQFGQIRQGLSIGFFLLSLANVNLGLKRRAILFSLLAVLFHYSSIIAVFSLLFFNKLKIRKMVLFCILSFSFVFFDVTFLMQMLLSKIQGLNFVFIKLSNYSAEGRFEKIGFSSIHIIYLLNTVLFYYYFKVISKSESFNYNSICSLYFLGVGLNFIFNSFPYLIRATYFLLVMEYIIVAYIVSNSKYKFNSLLFLLIYTLLALLRFYQTYISLL